MSAPPDWETQSKPIWDRKAEQGLGWGGGGLSETLLTHITSGNWFIRSSILDTSLLFCWRFAKLVSRGAHMETYLARLGEQGGDRGFFWQGGGSNWNASGCRRSHQRFPETERKKGSDRGEGRKSHFSKTSTVSTNWMLTLTQL